MFGLDLAQHNLSRRIKSRQAELNSSSNESDFVRQQTPSSDESGFIGQSKIEGLARSEFNFAWYTLYEMPNLVIPDRPRAILGDRHIFFYPSESDPPKVMIDIDKISKALWKAGYKNMSSIIEKQLTSIVPFNEHELDRIILYKNNSITILLLLMKLGHGESMDLRYQVAISKVQKEDFIHPMAMMYAHCTIMEEASDDQIRTRAWLSLRQWRTNHKMEYLQ
ncbi:hypothetical protein GH714_028643 [Hevea brasiliensis]|uniref:Uncharacterized protein n=1 Tax=Hevea brasiliensis TaxID=3981 RepID=A0A6A6M1B5_HEVBR|nr:hypothetical protein GH714_028643 [Hevea brasiliensis]